MSVNYVLHFTIMKAHIWLTLKAKNIKQIWPDVLQKYEIFKS
jgi:hypothetical protein